MIRTVDIAGQSFGRLTAIRQVGITKFYKAIWLFRCSCGNYHEAIAGNVMHGKTHSCGCFKKEKMTTHGLAGTRIDGIYRHMIDRCYNHRNNCYDSYGGRGITICEEWLNDKSAFFKWSVLHGYSDELSIDRKDNDKGYAPDNCRWATNIEQANNTSRNIMITVNGKSKTIAEWARERGIKPQTIRSRIDRGLGPVQALEFVSCGG